MMRVFVAINIDADVVAALSKLQNRLRKTAPQLKWVRPDNFHLTVKFLGDISQSRLSRVWSALSSASGSFEPFEISFRGVGVFGSISSPRVVWVGIREGADLLVRLANAADAALGDVGFELENRPFKPHLTLARSGRDKRALPREFARAVGDSSEAEFGRSVVESISIMRSQLLPGGPVYSQLDVVRLGE